MIDLVDLCTTFLVVSCKNYLPLYMRVQVNVVPIFYIEYWFNLLFHKANGFSYSTFIDNLMCYDITVIVIVITVGYKRYVLLLWYSYILPHSLDGSMRGQQSFEVF